MSCVPDEYFWNVPIAEHFPLTFCTFFKSCRFGTSAEFRHGQRTRLIKDRDLGVFCTLPSRLREFIEYYGIFC